MTIRGDSGLNDSGFYRSQKSLQRKNAEALDKLEKDGIINLRRTRYEANARPPKRNRTILDRIKSWFVK